MAGGPTQRTPFGTGTAASALGPGLRSILVGETKEKPGKAMEEPKQGKAVEESKQGQAAKTAEDMMSAADKDKGSKAYTTEVLTSLKSSPLFTASDKVLNELMVSLLKWGSMGKLEEVALEMQAKFARGEGGTYRSAVLDEAVSTHPYFLAYHSAFERQLEKALRTVQYDPTRIKPPIVLDRLEFSRYRDRFKGLVILVNQVWAVKAELSNYAFTKGTSGWTCTVNYTFWDHFGLDWHDVVLNRSRTVPDQFIGAGFVAWYILQHYRKAKPFITEMRVGRIGRQPAPVPERARPMKEM